MEIEWQSSFHLDFSTLWQSIEYMEAYLRRRRKAKIREKSDKLMIKDETQSPETHPTTPATVKRPRFSNIEDMLDKPLAVVMVPRSIKVTARVLLCEFPPLEQFARRPNMICLGLDRFTLRSERFRLTSNK